MYRKYRIQRKSLLYSGHRFINNLKILLFNACGSNKCTKTRLDSNTSMMRSIHDIGWKRMKRFKVRLRCILGMTVYQIFYWDEWGTNPLPLCLKATYTCLSVWFIWNQLYFVDISKTFIFNIYSVPAYVYYK